MSFQLLYKILNKGIEKIANYVIQRVIKAFFDSPKMNYQNFSRKVHFKMHKFMVDILMYLIILGEQSRLSQPWLQLQLQQVYAVDLQFCCLYMLTPSPPC